ncbi:hypothetical protein GCM10009113_21220 [Marinobacter szutsaonensis]
MGRGDGVMRDEIGVLAYYLAELLAFGFALYTWVSAGASFGWGALLGAGIVWFLARVVLVYLAAFLFR